MSRSDEDGPPYRLVIIVPVPHIPEAEARRDTLSHRFVPMSHARAQVALGHEVHVLFDGPVESSVDDGVRVHASPSPIPPFRGTLRSPHLVRRAAALRPDVIHVHHILAVENVAAATWLGRPVFAEFHGGAAPRSRLRRGVLRRASRRLAGSFFAAREHYARLRDAGALRPTLPMAVSPEISSRYPRVESKVIRSPSAPRFLVVGRIEPPKQPWETLAVFEWILRLAPGARFTWATPGGRELVGIQQALARRSRLAERVDLGRRSLGEMPHAYADADVVVATSRAEIGGTVMTEALCQGTPVAAFDLPTFRALRGDCGAVRLEPSRRPEALARLAVDLAAQPDLRPLARARFDAALSYEAIARVRSAAYRAALRET